MHFCISFTAQHCHVSCLHLSHTSPRGQTHHPYYTIGRQVQLRQFPHNMFLSWNVFCSSADAHFYATIWETEFPLISLITRSVVQLCIKAPNEFFFVTGYWFYLNYILLLVNGNCLGTGAVWSEVLAQSSGEHDNADCDDTFQSPPGVNLIVASKTKGFIWTMCLYKFCNSKVLRTQKSHQDQKMF